MKISELKLTSFLSYRDATLRLGGLTALVGPNASGKSNAVAAIKLLRDIPEYGLPTALLRRGGFDQLRHRAERRPYNPGLGIKFNDDEQGMECRYDLDLATVSGGRYRIKREAGVVTLEGAHYHFTNRRGGLTFIAEGATDSRWMPPKGVITIPEGQSAFGVISSVGPFLSFWEMFTTLQVVEINPARVRELQDPTPGYNFEPDGSNCASVFDGLDGESRGRLIDELRAIVPSLKTIEVKRFSNKMTLNFYQEAGDRTRTFLANQMSDGTLRAFAILLALHQTHQPSVLLVEEPEVAIHLGALRTLVEILREHSSEVQIVLTTHSADIIDALDVDELRVVWSEDGISRLASVADHTMETVRTGLITPGELLRADSLDPELR